MTASGQQGSEKGGGTQNNDAPGKEDRRKPKANFAFQRLALEPETGEEEEEESKIQLIIN